MEEDPGSVLGSDPPVLLLGYRKIAVSRLTDVERFQGDQLWETPRPQSPLAGSSLSGSLRGVGLLEKLEGLVREKMQNTEIDPDAENLDADEFEIKDFDEGDDL